MPVNMMVRKSGWWWQDAQTVIDMEDDHMLYRIDRDSEMRRLRYADIRDVSLQVRTGDCYTYSLVIVMEPAPPLRSIRPPIVIDIANTDACPEDVCEAIAKGVERKEAPGSPEFTRQVQHLLRCCGDGTKLQPAQLGGAH